MKNKASPFRWHRKVEFAAMIHIEIVMTRIVGVQDQLLHFLGASVEQNILKIK